MNSTISLVLAAVLASSSAHADEVPGVKSGRYAVANAEYERVERMKAQYNKLSRAEKEKRNSEANKLAARAIVLFRAERYKEAVENFSKSLELNPMNTSLYFQYGLALFKERRFEEGIFYVGWDTKTLPVAKYFHIGLAYFRLNDERLMTDILNSVKSGKDKKYSAMASYYLGLAAYEKKNYDEARGHFEYVLEHSDDPEIDRQAESYIDRIARAQAAENRRVKRFAVSGIVGAQYDTNILFTPDGVQDQGDNLDEGGARYFAGAQLSGKAVSTEKHDLAVAADAFYMVSPDDRFRRADPFLVGARLPYNYRGRLFERVFGLEVAPGYESLYLDANDDDERENILQSTMVNSKATFLMRKSWISSYELKLRQDDSKLDFDEAEDDASAFKSQIFTNQTFVLDPIAGKTLGLRAGYTLNSADGDNHKYSRFDLSGFYGLKLPVWQLSLVNNLAAYRLVYSDRDDDRADTNLVAGATLIRPLVPWAKVSFKLEYTKNFSNVTINRYQKWLGMLALSFDQAF